MINAAGRRRPVRRRKRLPAEVALPAGEEVRYSCEPCLGKPTLRPHLTGSPGFRNKFRQPEE
jgi:hypothetical protein